MTESVSKWPAATKTVLLSVDRGCKANRRWIIDNAVQGYELFQYSHGLKYYFNFRVYSKAHDSSCIAYQLNFDISDIAICNWQSDFMLLKKQTFI